MLQYPPNNFVQVRNTNTYPRQDEVHVQVFILSCDYINSTIFEEEVQMISEVVQMISQVAITLKE